MVQIKQTTETTFSALSFEDALVMVSLMDELAERFKKAYKLYTEYSHKEESDRGWDYEETLRNNRHAYIALGHQLHTLEKLGFRASLPGMIQYNPEDFPEFT